MKINKRLTLSTFYKIVFDCRVTDSTNLNKLMESLTLPLRINSMESLNTPI